MGQSTKYQLPWPEATDPADGPNGIGNLAKQADTVILQQIWTPLNNRVSALEAQGPGQVPGATNYSASLAANMPLASAGSWVDVLTSGGVLAVPTAFWLFLVSVEVGWQGNGQSGVTLRLRNVTTGSTLCAATCASHTEIQGAGSFYDTTLALDAVVAGGNDIRLQANAEAGNLVTLKYQSQQQTQGNATRMDWFRIS